MTKKELKNCRLYVITSFQPDCTYPEMVRAFVRGGADIVQFRDKLLSDRERLSVCRKLREICHRKNVLFIVNDRIDIAYLSGADGVHLGQDDIAIKEARKILGNKRIIGCSVSGDVYLAKKAEENGADYVSVGAIRKTPTKPEKPAVGLKAISRVKDAVQIPVVAIGGINRENVRDVLRAGADMVAVVRAVSGGDIEKAVRELKERILQEWIKT